MLPSNNKNHNLGLFKLVTIAIVSVDSVRNLPIGAQYGFTLVFLYIIAALTFFVPLAWVTLQLAAKFPTTGGSYVWIKSAFGESFGQLSLWLQWIYNIVWYPTIFTFISSTMASLLHPGLENNKLFIFSMSLGGFWFVSILHCFGLKMSSLISTTGAVIGTLFPMFLIMGLACYWLLSGLPSATALNWKTFLPNSQTLGNLSFFSNILFSLLGLDIIAAHVGNVKNSKKVFPKAIFISTSLILFTLILASLAICIIIPSENISLINGLMDLFELFFNKFHIPYAANIIGWCIVLGGFSIAASWMIGLAKILNVALNSVEVPGFLKKNNAHDAPYPILILQGFVYSILMIIYLFLPNINSSYWILSALTAQFALLYYVLLFMSARKLLRSDKSHSKRNNFLAFVLPTVACFMSLFGIIVGFIPPTNIPQSEILKYIGIMTLGFTTIFIFIVVSFFRQKKLAR